MSRGRHHAPSRLDPLHHVEWAHLLDLATEVVMVGAFLALAAYGVIRIVALLAS